MIKYGDRLRSLREKMSLSQKELADRLKINRSTYARYETSSTQPDYDVLNAIANFYDVSVDYLLGRTNVINIQEPKNTTDIELPRILALVYPEDIRKYRMHFNLDEEYVSKKTGISLDVYKNYEIKGMPSVEDEEVLRNFYNTLYKNRENDSRDIAKRMEQLRNDLQYAEGLAFDGEPMSEAARESLLDAMEFGVRLAKKNNKKFIPKKYRDNDEE